MFLIKKFLGLFLPLKESSILIKDSSQIKKTYRRMRIQIFCSMYLGYVCFYFTRKNITPVLHVFSEDMGLSLFDLGILSSVMYATYGIGKFFSGILADKSNIRMFMAFGLMGSSIINLFFPFLPSLYLITFFWGLNGIFQSMGFPPIAKGLVYWFSKKERASKWTLWSSSHAAGTYLAGILVAFILQYYDWRAAFWIPGIIGILVSFILLKTIYDKPSNIGLPSIEEYTSLQKPSIALKENKKDLRIKRVINNEKEISHFLILKTHVFKNKYLWYLAISYAFVYFIRFATLDWGTKFMYDVRSLSKVQTAFLWSFIPLLGIPGGIFAGWISDKLFSGRCTEINIIYLIFLAFSCLGFYYTASPNHILSTSFFLASIGFFVDGPQNLIGGVQASRVTVKKAVSSACGFAGVFGYIGAFLSGIGGSYIIEKWDYLGLYYSCFISCIICIFLVLLTYEADRDTLLENE